MSDVRSRSSSFRNFAAALFQGLLWGVVSVSALAAVAMMFIALVRGDANLSTAMSLTLETTAWTAMVASILALFLIGPLAGVIGWQLYRRGVVSPLAYAVVGMLCALVTPVLVVRLLAESMRYPTPNYTNINDGMSDGVAYLILAGIAVAGAFVGYMAGRVIQRTSA